jgi:hypothetical protein
MVSEEKILGNMGQKRNRTNTDISIAPAHIGYVIIPI